MMRSKLVFSILLLGWQASALALDPTFSIRVVNVNGTPIIGDGVAEVIAHPGDELTCEIFIRNWSPNGERMRGVQGEIDPNSYKSGDSGAIHPCAWQQTTMRGEKNANHARIDIMHPRFVYHGSQVFPITPSHEINYKWISVLVNDDGPRCAQTGMNYYIGTLDLCVGDDAAGLFTIDFVKGIDYTTLRDARQAPVEPVETEHLKINVGNSPRPIWITESEPGFYAIDARIPDAPGVRTWDRFQLVMNDSAGDIDKSMFEVNDGSDAAPSIQEIMVNGNRLTVVLSQPVRADTWTTLTHKPSGSFTRVGRFRGDVSGDGVHDIEDVVLLTTILNGRETLPPYRSDINGDGKVDAGDLLALTRFGE